MELHREGDVHVARPDINEEAHRRLTISPPSRVVSAEHVVTLTLILYVAHVAYAVFSGRVLYADGVNFFVNILETGTVSAGGRGFTRLFANAVTQAPLLMLVHLQVANMELLKYAYAIGLYLPYIVCVLIWQWTTRGVRAYRLFLLMFLFMGAMNSEFFLVSESHAAAALAFSLFPLLLFRAPWGLGTACLAIALAVPTVRSYESMLLLGPVLAAACTWRALRSARALVRLAWGVFGCWFAAGASVALVEVFNPSLPDSQTSVSFLEDGIGLFRDNMLGLFVGSLNLHFAGILSIIGLALVISALIAPPPFVRLIRYLIVGFAIGSGVLLVLLALFPAMMEIGLHYKARVLNAIIPALLGIGLLAMRARSVDLSRWSVQAFMVTLVLGVFQCGWHVIATNQWARYQSLFREELRGKSGYVRFEDSLLAERRIGRQSISGMNWPWTTPLMSIVLVPDGDVRSIIANPQPVQWEPFDPEDPAELPNLSEYGINYTEYLDVLLE